MSFAIKWGQFDESDNAGMIYLDAVTAYTQNYSGSVTKHPVDAGATITDHYIRDNPVFTLSGVITNVDISTGSYLISDLNDNAPFNVDFPPNTVSVESTDKSVLSKFIPDVVGQFLPESTPEITIDDPRADLIDQIRDALVSRTTGMRYNYDTARFEPTVEIVQLFEFDEKNLLRRIINNLVITSIRFNEDATTGHGLYVDITFEQITFVRLRKVDIPPEVSSLIKKKAETKQTLGKVDSTEKDTESSDNSDPNSKKDGIKDIDPIRLKENAGDVAR